MPGFSLHRHQTCHIVIGVILMVTASGGAQAQGGREVRAASGYGRLPLAFEVNDGQAAPQVRFLARGAGYTVFLTAQEAVLDLGQRPLPAVLRLRFPGARRSAPISATDALPGKSNYLIGNDPRQWHTDVGQYARVRYAGIYPGVDLVYYGNQRQLEHDFLVAPGSDPRRIRMSLEGGELITLEENGDLRVRFAGRELRLIRPVIYQQEGAERRIIDGGYVLRPHHEVGFRVGDYDHQKPLVIDPVVVFYSSFLGGNNEDIGNGIAVDSSGNAYVTGSTSSTNFPLRGATQTNAPAFQDTHAFVTKVNAAGTALVYSTYLGGGELDAGYGIAVDSSGAAYLTGETHSDNFPVQNAAQPTRRGDCGGPCPDAFVTKLNPAGSALVYSTFLGGDGEDKAYAIVVDAQGNAYVTGETHSINFPTLNPFQAKFGNPDDPRFGNAFVSKYSVSGSLVYSTHLGGVNAAGSSGFGIAVDAAGSAYVTGISNGDFPTTAGAFERQDSDLPVFATKFNPQGNGLVYSTYVGPTGDGTRPVGIAIDSAGNAYVTGRTTHADFPTTAGAFQRTLGNANGVTTDAFVTKLNPSGSALVYSTFLGGNNQDAGFGIAVDSIGNAYVTGFTRSANFPVSGASQSASGGGACTSSGTTIPCSDAFITELNATGSALVISTYLGGSNEDEGRAIAVDSVGYPYLTGVTRSTNFPTRNPFQAQYADTPGNPTSDAFVVKLIEPPTISTGGAVNAASYTGGVAPGSITSVFGVKLAPVTSATTVPLPTTLGGVSLRFNNSLAAPLFYTQPTQTNIQVPWELTGQTTAMLAATVAGLSGPAIPVPLAAFAPGIFTINQSGAGQGAIQIANTVIFAAPAGSIPGVQARPASKGEFLTIYCTGLGEVSNRPATGAAARGDLLSTTTAAATVTIGGVSAPVTFAGLSPGFVGLYQVNARVPDSSPVGGAVNLVISIGGAASNTVSIAVQ